MSDLLLPKPEKRGPKPRKRIARTKRPAPARKRKLQGKLRLLADDAQALFIKTRDGWKCARCGRTHEQAQIQASHLFPKGAYPSLRYAPDNVVAHCWGCHRFLELHRIEFDEWIIEKFGRKKFDDLRIRARAHHGPHDYPAVAVAYIRDQFALMVQNVFPADVMARTNEVVARARKLGLVIP